MKAPLLDHPPHPLASPSAARFLKSLRTGCRPCVVFLACLGPIGVFAQSPAGLGTTPLADAEAARQKIKRASDLPRFRYPLPMPPSQLINADDKTFNAFAARVVADLSRTTRDYRITDRATWRTLLEPLFCTSLLMGLDDDARQVLPHLRANEENEEVRLTAWRVQSAYLQGAQAAGTKTGLRFLRAFEAADRAFIDTLPQEVVRETLRRQEAMRQAAPADRADLITEAAKNQLDPSFAEAGTLDLRGASLLIDLRAQARVCLPLQEADTSVLKAYMDAHTVVQTSAHP